MSFISHDLYKELASKGDEIDKMLNGYISYLKQSKQGAKEPGANYSVHEEIFPYVTEMEEDLANDGDTVL